MNPAQAILTAFEARNIIDRLWRVLGASGMRQIVLRRLKYVDLLIFKRLD